MAKYNSQYTGPQIDAGIRPYKVYTAILTGDGTNPPTVTILENTIGNIVWTFVETNHVRGTLSGTFLENKTWAMLSPDYYNLTDSDPSGKDFLGRSSDNTIDLVAGIVPMGAYDNVWKFNIEIRVYP